MGGNRLKNRRLRIVSFMIALIAAINVSWPGLQAFAAQLPYETYYKDGFGQQIQTQAAYIPAGIIGYNTELPGQKELPGMENRRGCS
jgi:hypothetical protein